MAVNLYGYARNNPITFVDPLGLSRLPDGMSASPYNPFPGDWVKVPTKSLSYGGGKTTPHIWVPKNFDWAAARKEIADAKEQFKNSDSSCFDGWFASRFLPGKKGAFAGGPWNYHGQYDLAGAKVPIGLKNFGNYFFGWAAGQAGYNMEKAEWGANQAQAMAGHGSVDIPEDRPYILQGWAASQDRAGGHGPAPVIP